ncbi:hypothetical protein [Magnetospirillum sp. UT-4]|uniref:Bbp19 family protein n=1 Tax=Magnetospirillum sp. UT-4 TaxID=2681467 RepID=UPI001380C081|nr:hypothetical protein [Magnetospirillum sp. UT-4]CAA7617635.1 conserved hypothetical protein [Magnetospirillum sp. UT-4]
MPSRDPGWSWFDPPPRPAGEADRLALARAFARTFSGAEADMVLEHLAHLTTRRCLGPDSSDAALRMLEGQRLLVAHILAMVQQGREGL